MMSNSKITKISLKSDHRTVRLLFCCLLLLVACQPVRPPSSDLPRSEDPIADVLSTHHVSSGTLKRLGYAIQVGAFSRAGNAIRLEQQLKAQGVDAYHFLHESGFYKVRFGDHEAYTTAKSEAERLQNRGLIETYFVVVPDHYPKMRPTDDAQKELRGGLVATAKRFLGVPYRWGGEDRHNGFDCSGLTMVSYRLNGLDLPRNSRAQFKAGRNISKQQLQQGDLVFFATKGGTRVTHVGMYVGQGRFIHAPRPGKTVRLANLSSNYFKKTYVGARSYF